MPKLPRGFRAAGVTAGIKASNKKDLGLVLSDRPAYVAGCFTTNAVKAHCVLDNQATLSANETVRAIIVNSGNANACTGQIGLDALLSVKSALAKLSNIDQSGILTASTGVIGVPLPADIVCAALPQLYGSLSDSCEDFSEAILTTDLSRKICHLPLGQNSSILGISKGSGMIHPQMATTLTFVLTDARVEQQQTLQTMLEQAVKKSFNRISVDGDTSTNDMIILLANGASGEAVDPQQLQIALDQICLDLAKQVIKDGEGVSHVVEFIVRSPASTDHNDRIARGISTSLLVKTAIHGCDPNWGRILAAAGQHGQFDPQRATLSICDTVVLLHGQVQTIDKAALSDRMKRSVEYQITLDLDSTNAISTEGRAFGCDLSHDYVTINAEYTS